MAGALVALADFKSVAARSPRRVGSIPTHSRQNTNPPPEPEHAPEREGADARTDSSIGADATESYRRIMASIVFDTHAFVKRLTAAGMPEEQAEALADEQVKLIDERQATKADLERLEQRLIIRLGGMLVVAVVAVAALVKLL